MSMHFSYAVKQAAAPVTRSIIRTGLLMARQIVAYVARLHRTRSTYRRLCDLDDHTLKDIGLCRSGLMFYKHREAFHEMNEIARPSGHSDGRQ